MYSVAPEISAQAVDVNVRAGASMRAFCSKITSRRFTWRARAVKAKLCRELREKI